MIEMKVKFNIEKLPYASKQEEEYFLKMADYIGQNHR